MSTSTESSEFYFLKPKYLIIKSSIVVLVILAIAAFFILYYVRIYTGWNDYNIKCRNGRFFIAPLFGKSAEKTIEECTASNIQLSIQNTLKSEESRISNIEKNINNMQRKIEDVEGVAGDVNSATTDKLVGITNTLQENVEYVRSALSQILASIFISTQMNNGALTSYEDLQSSDIANIIDQYNKVNANFIG